jgi:hypothetical protein
MVGPEDDQGNGIGRRRQGAQLVESRRLRNGLPKGGNGDGEGYNCRAERPEHLWWNRENSGPPGLQRYSSLSGIRRIQLVHFEDNLLYHLRRGAGDRFVSSAQSGQGKYGGRA